MNDTDLLTYEELSKILKRSVISLRHDVMHNRISYIKLGTGKSAQVRFRKNDIEEWLSSKVVPAKGRQK